MEGILQRDDGEAARAFLFRGILAGDLDGAFVGFRTGIAEEDLLHPGTFAQHLRQHRAGFGVVQV